MFSRIVDLEKRIQDKEDRLSQLEAEAEGMRSPFGSGLVKVKGARFSVDDAVIRMAEIRIEIEQDRINLELAKRHLTDRMRRTLTDRERDVLELKYFEHKTAADIAEVMSLSGRQIRRIVRKALKRLTCPP